MSQTRCCVVCSRSSPKTIFSCRYKVHQRNIEVLREFFKRELDYGELCDRCYRLWYKHKRAKKDPQANTDPQQNKSRKRRSPPVTPTPASEQNGRTTTNNFYANNHNNLWHSPLVSSLPPVKKFRKDYEEDNLLLQDGYEFGHFDNQSYVTHDVVGGITHAPINLKQTNGFVTHTEEEKEDVSIMFNEQDEEDLLQQIESEKEKELQNIEGFIDSIRYFAKPPRISKRKPCAIKSPSKPDPIAVSLEPNYQKLFTSEKNGAPTPFDFLYAAGAQERVTTVKTLSQDISVYAPSADVIGVKSPTQKLE